MYLMESGFQTQS